ncbi:MAG: SdpI family protein [Chitinophagales bacterium]|nr:SdpI family protein [Chitinophagales bacterium]
MKNINWKKEALIWVALIAPLIYSAFMWSQLPDIVPSHWNINGEIDDYSGKELPLLLLPCMNLILYFILFFIPRIDPRKKNYELFNSSYQNIRLIVHIFFIGVHVFVMHATKTHEMAGLNFFIAGVGLFFAMLGNYMRTMRSNFFVGIRTPWTLSNEEVWKQTHALGGRVWFYGGLILAVISLFVPDVTATFILIGGIIILAFIPIIYSYLKYKEITRISNQQR